MSRYPLTVLLSNTLFKIEPPTDVQRRIEGPDELDKSLEKEAS